MEPKKSLGQNFLIDNSIIEKIMLSFSATKNDLIIEIGPGKGYLTKELDKIGCPVIAIEIDNDMKAFLTDFNNTKVIYDDFLQIDLDNLIKEYNYENLFLIANIPYYITTPIVKKIIDSNLAFKNVVLMVQKELAERYAARVGHSNYSSLTVFLNYHYDVKILFDVDKFCFFPAPKVDSAVIKLENKEKSYIKDYYFFEQLVKTSFMHKRKNLKNNLKEYDLEQIENILKANDLSLHNRAEDVSLEVFIELSNILTSQK